jgi:hypothetical protein
LILFDLRVQMGAGADRGAFRIRAWKDGAEWSGLDLSGHARLVEVRLRFPGPHLTRTGLVFSVLVAAIFGQTTGRQAHGSWRYLVVRCGAAAPVCVVSPASACGRRLKPPSGPTAIRIR